MKTSESISKIAPALLKAQRAITFAVKDSKNPHFKSTYADLGSVITACKPALNDAGIAFMQMPAPSDTGTIALTTRLVHESGEWIESTATCPLPKNDPQGYGSANSYLRRYALAAAVGLYQDDDDGHAAQRPQEQARPEPVRQGDTKPLDMSPKARAERITLGVNRGDAMNAAAAMAAWDDELRNAVWEHLSAPVQAKLEAVWPKEVA